MSKDKQSQKEQKEQEEQKEQKSYKILNLHVENIKKINVVDITPTGNVVILEGKNKQGKSSTLDSICYALGGKKLIPKNPVREGVENAEISIKIGEFTITRSWTGKDKSYLKIQHESGMRPDSPQNFLDAIVGDLAFDPLAFVTYDKEKRVKLLKKITALDTESLDAEYQVLYNRRTDVGRDVKRVEGELESYKELPEAKVVRPMEIVQAEYSDAMEAQRDVQALADKAELGKTKVREIKAQIDDVSLEIEKLMEKKKRLSGEYARFGEQAKVIYDNYVDLNRKKQKSIGKIPALRDEIAEVRKSGEAEYKHKRKKELDKELADLTKAVKKINSDMSSISEKKNSMIAEIKMPIKGLEIGVEDVLYEGVEFSETSQAQQIEVSMAIAMAENPKLKIVRIMNGSLLDDESMQKIKDIAEKNDYQVWIERVANSKSGGDTIYIEDGVIK